MKEDHANMPGMDHEGTKPDQGKTAAKPQQGQPPRKPDAATQSDKSKPEQTPRKS